MVGYQTVGKFIRTMTNCHGKKWLGYGRVLEVYDEQEQDVVAMRYFDIGQLITIVFAID